MKKVYFFAGYGTSFRDYTKLKKLLNSFGFTMLDGYKEILEENISVITHSYGCTRFIDKLNKSNINQVDKLLIVSPSWYFPKLDFSIFIKVITGYLYSKVKLGEIFNIFSTKRYFQVTQNVEVDTSTIFKEILIIYTVNDALVTLQEQKKIEKILTKKKFKIIEKKCNHNILDVKLNEVKNYIYEFLK